MTADSGLNLGGDPIYARVCDTLRKEILSGAITTGERLKIAEMSERYGVSMMPIREALQQLQGEGLIVLEPNKGARVRGIDRSFIENMYDIRGAIEGLLMGKLATRISSQQSHAATVLAQAYEAAVRDSDWPRAMALNKQFHDLLYQIADNPEALAIINQRWGLIDCLRRQFGFGAGRAAAAAREHKQLLKALKSHNGVDAERVARLHSEQAKNDLLKLLERAEKE